jgi:hypothetical protein
MTVGYRPLDEIPKMAEIRHSLFDRGGGIRSHFQETVKA